MTITIEPANENPPVVTTSTRSFTGYIQEDAGPKDYVRDQLLEHSLRLIVSDADIVSCLIFTFVLYELVV